MKQLLNKMVCIICMLGILFSFVSCYKINENNINSCRIIKNESWFNDVYIKENSIYYLLHITVENTSCKDMTIKLVGDLTEEYKQGIIKETKLNAISTENTDYFYISSNATVSFEVIFIGTLQPNYNIAGSLKEDRLLFPISIDIV